MANSAQSLASWTAVVLYSFLKEVDNDYGIPSFTRSAFNSFIVSFSVPHVAAG